MDDKSLEDRIRERAYELYIQAGQPFGKDEEFWQRAKREIEGGEEPKNGYTVPGF
jgi:hypothetical protein